jgi:hypothetical protein
MDDTRALVCVLALWLALDCLLGPLIGRWLRRASGDD